MSLTAESLFSSLSHEIRLRCLLLMQQEGELCVCELTHALGLAQPVVSRHLALLREAGLVSDRRAGVWIHYSISKALPAWAHDILAQAVLGTQTQEPFQSDLLNLAEMPNRPGAACCA